MRSWSLILLVGACSPLQSIKPNEDEVADDSDVDTDGGGTKPPDTAGTLDTAPEVDTDEGGTTGGTTGTTGGTTGTTGGTTGTGGDTGDTSVGTGLPAAELRFEYQLAIDDQGNLSNFSISGRTYSSALFLRIASAGGAVECIFGYGLTSTAGSGTASGPFAAWMTPLGGLGGMWVQPNAYTAFPWVDATTGAPCTLTGYDPATIHVEFLTDMATALQGDMPLTITGARTAFLESEIVRWNQGGANLDPTLYASSWVRLMFAYLPIGSRVPTRDLEFVTEGYQLDVNEAARLSGTALVPESLDGMTGQLKPSTLYLGSGLYWFTL